MSISKCSPFEWARNNLEELRFRTSSIHLNEDAYDQIKETVNNALSELEKEHPALTFGQKKKIHDIAMGGLKKSIQRSIYEIARRSHFNDFDISATEAFLFDSTKSDDKKSSSGKAITFSHLTNAALKASIDSVIASNKKQSASENNIQPEILRKISTYVENEIKRQIQEIQSFTNSYTLLAPQTKSSKRSLIHKAPKVYRSEKMNTFRMITKGMPRFGGSNVVPKSNFKRGIERLFTVTGINSLWEDIKLYHLPPSRFKLTNSEKALRTAKIILIGALFRLHILAVTPIEFFRNVVEGWKAGFQIIKIGRQYPSLQGSLHLLKIKAFLTHALIAMPLRSVALTIFGSHNIDEIKEGRRAKLVAIVEKFSHQTGVEDIESKIGQLQFSMKSASFPQPVSRISTTARNGNLSVNSRCSTTPTTPSTPSTPEAPKTPTPRPLSLAIPTSIQSEVENQPTPEQQERINGLINLFKKFTEDQKRYLYLLQIQEQTIVALRNSFIIHKL